MVNACAVHPAKPSILALVGIFRLPDDLPLAVEHANMSLVIGGRDKAITNVDPEQLAKACDLSDLARSSTRKVVDRALVGAHIRVLAIADDAPDPCGKAIRMLRLPSGAIYVDDQASVVPHHASCLIDEEAKSNLPLLGHKLPRGLQAKPAQLRPTVLLLLLCRRTLVRAPCLAPPLPAGWGSPLGTNCLASRRPATVLHCCCCC
mmetsp:Transcript_84266/g.238806  ORF Transcript_84266/g.238806 Transcript_84266/m.238806 type:complete len:205 (+) Transcript_84266:1000-1614(+)